MKKFLQLLAIVFATSVMFNFNAECKKTIKITCRAKGMELELCKDAINEWLKLHKNKYNVEIVTLPHASNECFALYQQWLSAGSFDVDILQMDVAWIGVFSEYLADLNELLNTQIDTSDYFAAIADVMVEDGRVLAMPWYTDCGIMYYRKDLLEKYGKSVPDTWEELYDVAKYIQDKEREDANKRNRFYGLVFQAKAFEILTCVFAEMVDSFGGAIITDGKVSVDSERCTDAVVFMIECLRNITSHSVLNYSEEDSRGMFQSGNAVFMRNWPYAWSLLNEPSTPVAGKVGVMAIPPSAKGGKASGVLGGWFLAVSKNSKNGKIAADLVRYLTSKEQQRKRAQYSYLPAFKSLYQDTMILRFNPFFIQVYASLEKAVARPSAAFGKTYPRASSEIFNMVNTIISDNTDSGVECKNSVNKLLNRLNKKLSVTLEKARDKRPRPSGGSSLLAFFKDLWMKLKTLVGMN